MSHGGEMAGMTKEKLELIYNYCFGGWENDKKPECAIYEVQEKMTVIIIIEHIKWYRIKTKKMLKYFIQRMKQNMPVNVSIEVCYKIDVK